MKVVALSGGVGGARLVDGLAASLDSDELSVVVNTGDDFRHCGLWICPDLDTVMYTLSGRAPIDRGWGLAEETDACMNALKRLGGPSWFHLSDQDLATHLLRAKGLDEGLNLSQVTDLLFDAHGLKTQVYPMCDAPHPTRLLCDGAEMEFQQWFVANQAEPEVQAVCFPELGVASTSAVRAVDEADLIIITPSNPYLSIDPILSLPALNEALENRKGACIAISPIVAGRAIKGPLGKLIPALATRPASAAAVVAHYGDLVDGWVVERGDEADFKGPVLKTDTVMKSRGDRKNLGRAVLDWAQPLL
jgi:LPPG:FO 2-phospho-L-lactate transferase